MSSRHLPKKQKDIVVVAQDKEENDDGALPLSASSTSPMFKRQQKRKRQQQGHEASKWIPGNRTVMVVVWWWCCCCCTGLLLWNQIFTSLQVVADSSSNQTTGDKEAVFIIDVLTKSTISLNNTASEMILNETDTNSNFVFIEKKKKKINNNHNDDINQDKDVSLRKTNTLPLYRNKRITLNPAFSSRRSNNNNNNHQPFCTPKRHVAVSDPTKVCNVNHCQESGLGDYPNRIVAPNMRKAGLLDRLWILHKLTNLAGLLCARVFIPPPRLWLHGRHEDTRTAKRTSSSTTSRRGHQDGADTAGTVPFQLTWDHFLSAYFIVENNWSNANNTTTVWQHQQQQAFTTATTLLKRKYEYVYFQTLWDEKTSHPNSTRLEIFANVNQALDLLWQQKQQYHQHNQSNNNKNQLQRRPAFAWSMRDTLWWPLATPLQQALQEAWPCLDQLPPKAAATTTTLDMNSSDQDDKNAMYFVDPPLADTDTDDNRTYIETRRRRRRIMYHSYQHLTWDPSMVNPIPGGCEFRTFVSPPWVVALTDQLLETIFGAANNKNNNNKGAANTHAGSSHSNVLYDHPPFGYLHIRRSDAKGRCSTTLPKLMHYLPCSLSGPVARTYIGSLPPGKEHDLVLFLSSDEAMDGPYRSDLFRLLSSSENLKFARLRVLDLDRLVQETLRSAATKTTRTAVTQLPLPVAQSNFVQFFMVRRIAGMASFFLEQRREFACRTCDQEIVEEALQRLLRNETTTTIGGRHD